MTVTVRGAREMVGSEGQFIENAAYKYISPGFVRVGKKIIEMEDDEGGYGEIHIATFVNHEDSSEIIEYRKTMHVGKFEYRGMQ